MDKVQLINFYENIEKNQEKLDKLENYKKIKKLINFFN